MTTSGTSNQSRSLVHIQNTIVNGAEHKNAMNLFSIFYSLFSRCSSLNRDAAIILANSIIHSRLDYCNSLFYDLPEISIIKLQRVQNSLARVVCKASRSQSHSSDLLRSLHWLPVAQRIKYKIAVLTYKTIHFNKPSYLADLIKPYHSTRSLRSSCPCPLPFQMFDLLLLDALSPFRHLLYGTLCRVIYGHALPLVYFAVSSRPIFPHRF